MGTRRRTLTILAAAGAMLILALPAAAANPLATSEDLYVPKPDQGALRQIADLRSSGDTALANGIAAMIATPQASWFTSGTPKSIEQDVKATVQRAAGKGKVPVLVAYDLPFRDCGQYSAGGALDTASYLAWIDGFAKGIGNAQAVLILEPDGLGIIPWNTDINGNAEWCQPDLTGTGLTPETANSARYEQLNGAVDRLAEQPNVAVYLDGTHAAWLGVGDIADRLVRAGVGRAAGFYLNVSNFQFSANSVQYGTWISECIASGNPAGCANQYWNGGPDGTAIADLLGAWQGVALSPYGEWSDTSDVANLNTSGINARFAGTTPTTHFVVDTSRNGVGPWSPPQGLADAQDWCNPPDRGLGIRPTTDTGIALLDAWLWIKTPGQSDGQCYRGTAGPLDPVRGTLDPAAGVWFPDLARELVEHANPPLGG